MKNKGEILDEQITTFLTNRDTKSIQELLDFEFEGSILDESGMISFEFLRAVMIRRDEIVYDLKEIQMEEELDYESMKAELEVHPEESAFNPEIYESTDIITIHAKGKNEQPITLYYYASLYSKNHVIRQMRTTSQDKKISRMERASCYVSNHVSYHHNEGEYHARIGNDDGSLLVIMRNEDGIKQAALYQDDIFGCKYFEYDKDGNITLNVSEEAVGHNVVIDGQTYFVYDGFFEPSERGYILRRFNDGETIQDINPSDIKRSTKMANSDLRKKIVDSLDGRTQEEILGILQALDPIFKVMFSHHDIEDMSTTKMEKLVTWLGNFSKRLKVDRKLATQDSAVKSAMRSAVSQTIGKTDGVQADITTPVEDKEGYKG